jgi:putative ubiquitin-RnfH superfamily antitoxin RatB of RatAB toxin-antitoxin module
MLAFGIITTNSIGIYAKVTQAPDYLPNSNRTEIETESEIDFINPFTAP